jgi:hypothetical protein
MYFMNSPTTPGQNNSGENAARRRCRHRPHHALGGKRVGLLRRHALRHAALGEFGDDDRVVNQHADGEDQREQHDDVHGQAGDLQSEHAGEE